MATPTLALVLDLIRTAGPISRVELAAHTGLTPATITNTVRDLLAGGLVRETGRRPVAVGSPRRLLDLDPDAWYAVGVQLSRSAITTVVTDFTGRRLVSAQSPGVGDGTPQATLTTLAAHVEHLLASAAVPRERVLGLGLVSHGPQDRERGMILTAQPTPAWQRFPLTSTLAELLALPVLLENDATAAAVSEQWTGALDVDTFGVVWVGGGIGGGVVVGGETFGGPIANPVEIGHVPLDPASTVCACGNRGCVEVTAGPGAVVAQAMTEPLERGRLRLSGRPEDTLNDFERLAVAADRGDRWAKSLLVSSAERLADAVVTLMNLFDLDTVVLSGPAMVTAGPLYAEAATRAAGRGALARLLRPVRVLVSPDAGTAAAVGGALVVLRSPLAHAEPVTAAGTKVAPLTAT
ncbi:ROK family transcriptional regulator [Kineosporia rhizophila]|uniref:ROK family transcriptional regulator n=1 Tax=Kineosporia TaxID=49184 RepID=UPI001E2B24B8|nr:MULTISPECIES: ROK family transcriptional regulator [Kineosporia]MCE0536493.1 ROK family transcriptional regulator [Kineosporia rhizophila]GLY15413.1 sugar kinase [Kineosporia sp. NBRC 101677]